MAMSKGYQCSMAVKRGTARVKCKVCLIEAKKIVDEYKSKRFDSLTNEQVLWLNRAHEFMCLVVGVFDTAEFIKAGGKNGPSKS